MGTHWTDESAIVRDLSFAQGRWVPGDIDVAVDGEKPPAHNITEDTEEEYFRHWTTDGDFSSGPDLMKIKKMLELVQDEGAPSEEISSGQIEITKLIPKRVAPVKLDPKAVVYVPKVKNTKENVNPIPNKPRRARNVAIASILALGKQISDAIEPPKLCRPEDFIKPKQEDEKESERVQDSVNKVSNWLQSQDIASMFKKKSSVQSLPDDEQRTSLVNGSVSMFKVKNTLVQSEASVKSPPKSQGGKYVPSKWAEEYYKKAVDRSLMRDLVRDDVWGRAEKLMKEIDEKKAEELRKQQELEAEALLAADIEAAKPEATEEVEQEVTCEKAENDYFNEDKTEGIAHMLLSKHRHELFPGDCIVCKVLTVTNQDKQDNQDNKTSEPTKPSSSTPVEELLTKQTVSTPSPSDCQADMTLSITGFFDDGCSLTEPDFTTSDLIVIQKPGLTKTEPEVTKANFNVPNQIILEQGSLNSKADEITNQSTEAQKTEFKKDFPMTIPEVTDTIHSNSEAKSDCTDTSTELVKRKLNRPKHTFEQLLISFDDFDDDKNLQEFDKSNGLQCSTAETSGLMRTAFLENLNQKHDDLRSTYLSESDSYEDIDI